MKNLLAAMFAVSLLAGASSPSAAQPQKGKGGRPEMGPGGGGGGGELSQDQREKVEAAMKAERDAAKPLQRDLRDAVMKLSDLLEDVASDKELQAGMDRVEKAQKALQDQRERSQAKIRALLPVRQRAMMMVHMGMMGPGAGQQMGHDRMGKMRRGTGGPGMQGGMGGPGMHGGMGGPGMHGGGGGPGMQGGPDEEAGGGPDRDEGSEDAEP